MEALMPILAIAAALWLMYSLAKYWLTTCPKCKGTGRVHHPLFESRYMPCPRCGRKGEIRGRFGRRN